MQGEWYTSGEFGNQGHQESISAKAGSELPEFFTLNGHMSALTEIAPIQANVGEREDWDILWRGRSQIGSSFHVVDDLQRLPLSAARSRTAAHVAPACLAMLLSDSWAMR